jgi:hypothetical protein
MKWDPDEIARRLGAKRRGTVVAGGGYLGAMQLLADVETRFRAPKGGGRSTDPSWTKTRLVRLAPRTLDRLQVLAERVRAQSGVRLEPMQLAALLIEDATDRLDEDTAGILARTRRGRSQGPSDVRPTPRAARGRH